MAGQESTELDNLQEQQRKVLDRAIYVGMTATDAREFDRRAQRINDLQRALGRDLDRVDKVKKPEPPQADD